MYKKLPWQLVRQGPLSQKASNWRSSLMGKSPSTSRVNVAVLRYARWTKLCYDGSAWCHLISVVSWQNETEQKGVSFPLYARVYLMRGFQKYERKWILTMAFWDTCKIWSTANSAHLAAHFCPALVCSQKATVKIQFLPYFWNPLIK